MLSAPDRGAVWARPQAAVRPGLAVVEAEIGLAGVDREVGEQREGEDVAPARRHHRVGDHPVIGRHQRDSVAGPWTGCSISAAASAGELFDCQATLMSTSASAHRVAASRTAASSAT